MSDEFVAPESNRWSDFRWPDWVPGRQRELIEKFWSAANSRGPADWLKSGKAAYNLFAPGLANGDRVRTWSLFRDGRQLLEGRLLHRWNNIWIVIADDGAAALASELATDESIAAMRERLEKKRAELEAQLAALGPRP